MTYHGPATCYLTDDQLYLIYLVLLTYDGAGLLEIREEIHRYLHMRDHPGLLNEPDR